MLLDVRMGSAMPNEDIEMSMNLDSLGSGLPCNSFEEVERAEMFPKCIAEY